MKSPDDHCQLLVEEDHEIPLVKLQYVLMEGAASDTCQQEGHLNFALEMLLRGGRQYSRQQVSQTLYGCCQKIDIKVDADLVKVNVTLPQDKLDDFSHRFVDVVQDACPDIKEIDLLRQELNEGLMVELERPVKKSLYQFNKALYLNDSYSNFVVGTPKSLQTVTADRLQERKQAALNRQSLLLLGGAVTPAQARQVSHTFSEWVTEPAEAYPVQQHNSLHDKRLALWHDPHQKQASVTLGWCLPAWNDQDFVNGKIVESILCSDFTSNLCQDFRQRAGLTYGISGRFLAGLRGRLFKCQYQTASRLAPQFLSDLLNVLKAFAQGEGGYTLQDQDQHLIEGVVDLAGEKLEETLTMMNKSLPFHVDTAHSRLDRQLEKVLYGSRYGDLEWMHEALNQVTADKVQQMAQKLFDVPGIVVSIVDNMDLNGQKYQDLYDWNVILNNTELLKLTDNN